VFALEYVNTVVMSRCFAVHALILQALFEKGFEFKLDKFTLLTLFLPWLKLEKSLETKL